jgi:hypothetical protein
MCHAIVRQRTLTRLYVLDGGREGDGFNWEVVMESFVRRQNIADYRHLLTTVADETERPTILKSLTEEEQQEDNSRLNVGQESHHAYQQYAEECLRWADEADSEQHRELFLSMARAWTQADLILKGVMIPKSKSESASLPSLEDDF